MNKVKVTRPLGKMQSQNECNPIHHLLETFTGQEVYNYHYTLAKGGGPPPGPG